MKAGRDVWWHEAMADASADCPAEELDAEHPLFVLYTSGSTGKPKGIQHSTAGYLLGVALTHEWVFDIKEEDVYWCTADVGWVTGHSYIVYGPLCNGTTAVMYEGAPDHPRPDRFWAVIEKYGVNVFYTAPTAIRAFIKWGDHLPARHDLSSLRLLGTVGEPINPEAWMWYRRVIGGDRCPIIDTWWQTETGAIMMTPLPGAIPAKPGSCTLPFFGVSPKILREDGSEAGPNEGGYLVIDQPWPSMLRTVWGNEERFRKGYFSRFPGKYFTGDGARRDEDGYFWVMGRVDDVVNVSGHRLGTAELESALVAHPAVAEAAVVARPDEMTGQALVAFVTLKTGVEPTPALKHELAEHVGNEIGKFARPASVRFADAVPKTRSGKIMRRLLAELASGKEPAGDVTTLEDISVLAKLRGEDE
jgi:acetyl-CoA synthetase